MLWSTPATCQVWVSAWRSKLEFLPARLHQYNPGLNTKIKGQQVKAATHTRHRRAGDQHLSKRFRNYSPAGPRDLTRAALTLTLAILFNQIIQRCRRCCPDPHLDRKMVFGFGRRKDPEPRPEDPLPPVLPPEAPGNESFYLNRVLKESQAVLDADLSGFELVTSKDGWNVHSKPVKGTKVGAVQCAHQLTCPWQAPWDEVDMRLFCCCFQLLAVRENNLELKACRLCCMVVSKGNCLHV